MTRYIPVPLWLLAVVLLLAGWTLIDRLLIPTVRWYLKRRIQRVIDGLNRRLEIKLQPFKLTKRQVLIDRLVFDPFVMEAADAHAETEDMPRKVAQATVERYAQEIVPAFNAYIYFQVGYWLARRVTQFLYRVRLGFADEQGLANIPQGSTVVFLMNHRSNMDYLLVSYMVAGRSALSYAVGEWARIWPLETLIRSMGAYFVRRRSRNVLYRRVLQRYVQMATAAGVTQAVYPEGGLSRDGLLRAPKLGLLDYMLRDFDPQRDRDIVFIPVGINYDRTLEDRTLLLDLEPDTERQGVLAGAAATLRFLGHNLMLMLKRRWHRFGYACVNLGTPISMASYLRRQDLRLHEMEAPERFDHVAKIGEDLMARIGEVVPVLPVSLVATVFTQDPAAARSELEIKAAAFELIRRFEAQGAKVYIPRESQDYSIEVGLRALKKRRLIEQVDGLLSTVPAEIPVLRYYANSIYHLWTQTQSSAPQNEGSN